MLVFPNCKINLGLHVVAKRPDGFHNIETVFYPIDWCDALEVIENRQSSEPFVYSQSGIHIDAAPEQNLIHQAWKIIREEKNLPSMKVHLHKHIPMGAGLGGGSSDAAHFINLLSEQFGLGFSETERLNLASRIGADCAFFIRNRPVYAAGRGDVFSEVRVNLDSLYILVVYPNVHSNTKEAYDGLTPQKPKNDLLSLLKLPVWQWSDLVVNDFEMSIFKKYPVIKLLKDDLYAAGALYASMSGSGSAVFGIFENEPVVKLPDNFKSYLQKPVEKIL